MKFYQWLLFKPFLTFVKIWIYEPPHDKTNKMICAPSGDSDQPGHPPSLIRVFAVRSVVAKDPSFLHADSEDSDQTGRMPRLIWVFAGRTCHFVGFVMRRLICCLSVENLQRSFFIHSWSGTWAIKPIVPILHYTLQIKKPKHFYSYGQDYNFRQAQC